MQTQTPCSGSHSAPPFSERRKPKNLGSLVRRRHDGHGIQTKPSLPPQDGFNSEYWKILGMDGRVCWFDVIPACVSSPSMSVCYSHKFVFPSKVFLIVSHICTQELVGSFSGTCSCIMYSMAIVATSHCFLQVLQAQRTFWGVSDLLLKPKSVEG